MRKPSVVFLNRVYTPCQGATGRMLRDLARGFAKNGWDVTVITTGPRAKKEKDGAIRIIRVKGAERITHPLMYVWIWTKMLMAGLALPKHNLTVTMTDPPLLVVVGRFISNLKKSRHIHWCQDLYPDVLPSLGFNFPGWLMNYCKRVSRRAMRKCDKVVVIGRCMARQVTHSGLVPSRVCVIPNWPDYELLTRRPERTQQRSDRNGSTQRSFQKISASNANKASQPADKFRSFDKLFKDGDNPRFRVLYSGNLGRANPFQTILKAAEILDKLQPDVEFVFVGGGPNFERLARERSKRRLQNIRFLPYQPSRRLRDLMESGDLHLVTMRNSAEGMVVPSKFYSAMAVQRPCILVGPRESETGRVIEDFHAGTIVPEGDARKLAAAIRAYRLDSNLWFKAHEGAAEAGQVFVPRQSIGAFLERANDIVGNAAPLKFARK